MAADLKPDFSLETLALLFAFVWPGMLSMLVYRQMMPTRIIDWKETLIPGLFYSVVDYVALFPLTLFVLRGENLEKHPFGYWVALVVLVIVGPVLLPVFFVWLRGTKLGNWMQSPYQTSFDFFFAKRKTCYVLIHLNDGSLIAGFWGLGSFASSYPEQGDLYLSEVISVDATGKFEARIPRSRGLLIRKDQYRYLELFDS